MEIHVYLLGRLGNQLFQYAFAKHLQKQYGGKIYLNIYDLKHYSAKVKHTLGGFNYDMKDFKLNEDVIIEDVKLKWYVNTRNLFVRLVRKLFCKGYFNFFAKRGSLIWLKSTYINIPKIHSNKIFICGFWQDIRYFEEVADDLRELIVPTTLPVSDNAPLFNVIEKEQSVCISIRGGNYLYPTLKDKFFVCDRQYFYDAIDLIIKEVSNPKFIIFSDDIAWVKEYMAFEKRYPGYTFLYESGKDAVEEKIRLMTNCKHFIISNSTFSWWAQFLAKNKNKIVVAPNIWFGDGQRIGLYEDSWRLIEIKK